MDKGFGQCVRHQHAQERHPHHHGGAVVPLVQHASRSIRTSPCPVGPSALGVGKFVLRYVSGRGHHALGSGLVGCPSRSGSVTILYGVPMSWPVGIWLARTHPAHIKIRWWNGPRDPSLAGVTPEGSGVGQIVCRRSYGRIGIAAAGVTATMDNSDHGEPSWEELWVAGCVQAAVPGLAGQLFRWRFLDGPGWPHSTRRTCPDKCRPSLSSGTGAGATRSPTDQVWDRVDEPALPMGTPRRAVLSIGVPVHCG